MHRQGTLRIALAAALLGAIAPVAADTLLIDRAQREASSEPERGMSMDAVVARHGEPVQRFDPVGGDRPQHPPITKWAYEAYTVYFERDKVIDVVLNRSTVLEQGPKPPR